MPGGRPTKFTEEIKTEILERLVNGEYGAAICRLPHMPNWTNLWRYRERDEDFRNAYARARQVGMEVWEDEIYGIASDTSRDYQPDGKGGVKSDNTSVQRDRLRVDTKKWLMSKVAPKEYGDKLQQELSGKDGEKLNIVVTVSGYERKDDQA